jgi:hypothetical protein
MHCLTVRGQKISRPFGQQLRTTKPNEVLHYDFLSMPLGNGDGAHLIERMLEGRQGPVTHVPEIKVQLVGLDPLEASWEIAGELRNDVLVLFKRFEPTMPVGKLGNQLKAIQAPPRKEGKAMTKPKAVRKP